MPLMVSAEDLELSAKSSILIEASTGKVLNETNADEKLHPASMTKVMTMLLIMEALESGKINLEEKVNISNNAASMGGSQVFLEGGSQLSVKELLKIEENLEPFCLFPIGYPSKKHRQQNRYKEEKIHFID